MAAPRMRSSICQARSTPEVSAVQATSMPGPNRSPTTPFDGFPYFFTQAVLVPPRTASSRIVAGAAAVGGGGATVGTGVGIAVGMTGVPVGGGGAAVGATVGTVVGATVGM